MAKNPSQNVLIAEELSKLASVMNKIQGKNTREFYEGVASGHLTPIATDHFKQILAQETIGQNWLRRNSFRVHGIVARLHATADRLDQKNY